MGARGRTSQASLTVASISELAKIPLPPTNLTKDQGEIWRLVMASRSAEMIEPEAYPVLVEYCRSIVQANILAKEIEKFDSSWAADDEGLRRWDKLLAMQDRLSKAITSLSVKLRLTPSTRFHSGTAARVGNKKTSKKPWQIESE